MTGSEDTVFVVGKSTDASGTTHNKGKSKMQQPKQEKFKKKNWTTDETTWLIDEVSKKKHILESKATNRTFKNLNIKNNTWHEIARAYANKIHFTPRTVENLRSKWDNLKNDTKRRSDALKKHLNQTGATPNSKLHLTTQEERIMDIMNVVKSSLDNPFDADSCSSISHGCVPNVEFGDGDLTQIPETQFVDEQDDAIDFDYMNRIGEASADDEDDVKFVSPAQKISGLKKKSLNRSFVTPPPKKTKRLTREDLDAAQFEFWELQKKHMIEKHIAYMDTLDAIRGIVQEQNGGNGLSQLSKAASSMNHINILHDLDQI